MPQRIDISKEELERLYWKEGLNGYVHKLMMIAKIPRRKHQEERLLPQQFNKRKSSFHYLNGVYFGDGSASKYVFQLRAIDIDFHDKFKKELVNLGFLPKTRLTKSISKKPTYNSYVCSMNLCKIFRKNKIIVNKHFVNGIIDSEATVGKYGYTRILRISMTNICLMRNIQTYLKTRNIKTHFFETEQTKNSFKPYSKIYHLEIRDAKNFLIFHKYFHFSIKRKQDKLDEIVKSYSQHSPKQVELK